MPPNDKATVTKFVTQIEDKDPCHNLSTHNHATKGFRDPTENALMTPSSYINYKPINNPQTSVVTINYKL